MPPQRTEDSGHEPAENSPATDAEQVFESPFSGSSTARADGSDPVEELLQDSFLPELQDACAEFFEGFGFKANLGRIWITLFYAVHPLSQKELMQILQLSAGMVSQGLNELSRFGLISTTRMEQRRETFYTAERNLAKATSSLLGRREDRIIDRVIQRVEEVKMQMAIQRHDTDLAKQRLQGLEEVLVVLQLAKAVLAIFETFSKYSYHAMKLGVRALLQLRVADLPKWLIRRSRGDDKSDKEGNDD